MPYFQIETETTYVRKLTVHVRARNIRSAVLAGKQAANDPDIGDSESLTVLSDEYVHNDGSPLVVDKFLTQAATSPSVSVRRARQLSRLLAFVEKVSELLIWGEPDPAMEGEPFAPSGGLDDSHECLMGLIEQAREVLKNDAVEETGSERLARVCVPGYVVDLNNPKVVERACNALIDDILAAANHGEVHHLVSVKDHRSILPQMEDIPSWAEKDSRS